MADRKRSVGEFPPPPADDVGLETHLRTETGVPRPRTGGSLAPDAVPGAPTLPTLGPGALTEAAKVPSGPATVASPVVSRHNLPPTRVLALPLESLPPTRAQPITDEPEVGDDPFVGKVVGEYRLIEPLGRGGFARVYRGEHLVMGAPAAVKILQEDLRQSAPAHRRFARETAALQKLRHPNLVSIIDSGVTEDERPYIVMDLVQGPTLRELLLSERSLSIPRAARLARQLALGLSEVHARGFVHRDLKPKNVMVVGRPPREQLKILDFGLALITDPASEHTRLTFAGHRLGTARWMAPEQIRDPATVGPAADLYCLGLLLYTLVVGEPPFLGKPEEVLRLHLEKAPAFPPELGELTPLLRALLEKQPERRPPDALAVVDAIDGLDLPEPTETLDDAPVDLTVPRPAWMSGLSAAPLTPEAESIPYSSGPERPAPALSGTNRMLLLLVVLLTVVALFLVILIVRGTTEPRPPTVRPVVSPR